MAVEGFRPVRDIDYHFDEPSLTPATYRGKQAPLLGLKDQLATRESATQLFNGYHPDGMRLVKYMHKDRRGAFELTINMPKDPSLLAMIGKEDRIREVLAAAGDEVGRYVEQNAVVRVRRKLTWGQERKPDNLVWLSFMHPASRAGDPHLHLHLVFYNFSYDRQEKTRKAIETRYIDQRKIGEIAHKSLVRGLRRLGYKVKDTGREFEVVGVPAEVKAEFSRRRDQIKELEGRFPKMRAKGRLSVIDRPPKEVFPLDDRLKSWVSRITDQQLQGLRSMVRRAKESTRRAQLSQWLDRTRAQALQHSEAADERGRGFSR